MKNERGYTLLIIIVLLALAGVTLSGTLMRDATGGHTINATRVRSEDFVAAESAIGRVMAWLRLNSQSLVEPYRREVFYSRFAKTAPVIGGNDDSVFTLPVQNYVADTSDAVMLVNDDSLGTARFPSTRNISTNQLYDAAAQFASATFGDAQVRLTLLNAVAVNPALDYGPPPNPVPETDFYPIYRLDAMTSLSEGAHVSAIVKGHTVNRFDVGIYGEDFLEIRQPCDSYKSSVGVYSTAIRRANCPAGSNSTSAIHKNEEVYGTLKTNGEIDSEPPFGGETCADFVAGCPNKGETCSGEDCGVPLLDEFYPWTTYCPTSQGNLTVTGNVSLTLAGTDAAHTCWDTVTISTNSQLTLTSTNAPYYFRTLTFQNNSNSQLNVQPSSASGKVEVYVQTITGNALNGNQMINANGRPSRFTLNYLGANALTLNGTAAMNVALVSPNAAVTVSGNFSYSGALLAKELYLTGSGGIHYDEDLKGTGPVVDIQYRLSEIVQHYR